MTLISQWLAAEEPDRTEPASYYRPGPDEWDDLSMRLARGRRLKQLRLEIEEVYIELMEDEEE